MARGTVLLFFGALLIAPLSGGYSQDVTKVASDHYKVLFENQYVRVLKCIMKPGDKDPVHVHAAAVYYLTESGKLSYTPVGGKTEVEEGKIGDCMWSDAEGPHTSENTGTTPISWIMVEVKGAKAKAVPVKH